MNNQEISTIACYINSILDSNSIIQEQGHFTDSSQNNYMILGTSQLSSTSTSSNTYKGFLYQIIVDTDTSFINSQVSTDCGGLCLACLAINNICMPDCNINYFPTSLACTKCDINCEELGCRDSNSSCNLCQDPTCLICTDYYGNCNSYKCSSGFYKFQGMNNCEACDSSCRECKGSGSLNCTSCNTGVLLNGACHPFCPTGYTQLNNLCELALSEIVNLDLLKISSIVNDTQFGFKSIAGSSLNFYPKFDSNDP